VRPAGIGPDASAHTTAAGPRKVPIVFDQVLAELSIISIAFILIPLMLIAAAIVITGQRKKNR
jgi:hypothetical protein